MLRKASSSEPMEQASSSAFGHGLDYTIADFSSFVSNYHPSNIKDDKPKIEASRWACAPPFSEQYVTLDFHTPCLIETVLFGKRSSANSTSLHTFQLKGSYDGQTFVDLLKGSLYDHPAAQPIRLGQEPADLGFRIPIRFLKIIPLSSFDTKATSVSIWHVQVYGQSQPSVLQPFIEAYEQHVKRQALRLCLKHLRQEHMLSAYNSLADQSRVSLEDEKVARLSTAILEQGDMVAAEALLRQYVAEGIFREYLERQPDVIHWTRLNADMAQDRPQPCARGGHQMCVDVEARMVYLVGGWNGEEDLGDFWRYCLTTERWTLLSDNMAEQGGPKARSCHAVCYNQTAKQIYVLGQYHEHHQTMTSLPNTLYRYDVDLDAWTLLQHDTAANGGPCLIYDHQLVCDSDNQVLYVFGGNELRPHTQRQRQTRPSGLFAYNILNDTWNCLREDASVHPEHGDDRLLGRAGHTMVYSKLEHALFIVGGQRSNTRLGDFVKYDIAQDTVTQVMSYSPWKNGPSPGFVQRGTVDNQDGRLFILSGLRSASDSPGGKGNTLWIWDQAAHKWSVAQDDSAQKEGLCTPIARYAHQLLYDPHSKTHYLFAGNPGGRQKKIRLGDMWKFTLSRPDSNVVLNECVERVRWHRAVELAQSDRKQALRYLKAEVASTIDQDDGKAMQQYRQLVGSVFKGKALSDRQLYAKRREVHAFIMQFLPQDLCEPGQSLTEYVFEPSRR
eukprot:TRINITY_DN12503_c1_g2_i1.p1 TRINITY_DN12503_c1_g2~~TRINITY_DN12503_c1_g2_i1.p1  ORF type:complete len:727 (+),score=124.24 TRINITY_DN12503_c1_g2_i1:111-2291(+)